MFPRSERFVEKIEITPGPNHYDVRAGDDDPYKRFGFLGKTKRFNENTKGSGTGGTGSGGPGGLYERNSLSTSLPSLVIDDGTQSPDTASVHSNGSTTPDHTKRPTNPRSKSSDKLGLAFAANTSKVEERLKRELADLTEKFEKYRIARQKELDVMSEKQKKAEIMYQTVVKDKNAVQTQLASKESEIAELGVRHNMLKATLEKSEKAATVVNEKIGKTNQLQKRIDELEKLLIRTKASLEEQESISSEALQKLDLERQQLQQQLINQKELVEQDALQASERQRLIDGRHAEELKVARENSNGWMIKFEDLERLLRDLEQKLETERRTVEELRAALKREREELQGQIDSANVRIRKMEQEKMDIEIASKAAVNHLQEEKANLDQALLTTRQELEELTERYETNERMLEEQRARHLDTVEIMTQRYEEQQAEFAKERQEHSRARQDLEESMAHLISELSRNREALFKMQQEKASLQDKYDQSQSELQQISSAKAILDQKHEQLKLSFEQEQERWAEKYNTLLAESESQKQESDVAMAELKERLDKRNEELSRVMKSVVVIQAELEAVESQREEVTTQRIEEERKAIKMMERLTELEQKNIAATQQMSAIGKDKEALETERDQLKHAVAAKEKSIGSLESEIKVIASDSKEQSFQDQKRIKELENMHLIAAKEVELFRAKEKEWVSEKARSIQDAASQKEQIEILQCTLAKTTIEKQVESKASAGRIKELEDRCRAMESAFKLMFDKSGSTQEIKQNQSKETWEQYSAAVLDVLSYHTNECSISKTEHAALLEEKSSLEQTSATLRAALQEQEATFKEALDKHAGLLAKIAELEDQIRQLNVQVELLEAESIGKVAIIKALQDEYDYQEKIIRDLSKNEDLAKEVAQLEDELRRMTDHTRETDEWIKQVQEDNNKYREAYVKADVAREETLLDMAKLHDELAEAEQARLQVENQLQAEVSALIKKSSLSSDELSRLSKMSTNSTQNMNLKQKIKQIVQLKEEILALKKKNITLSNTRDSLRLKCLKMERELEAYKAANITTVSLGGSLQGGYQQSNQGSISGASSVISSSSTVLGASDQAPNGKLQLQGLVPETSSAARSRSNSPGSTKSSREANQRPIRSRAARSYMAGHLTAN
ncbi:hypothetical protein BGZ54_008956 [Gamsiella multidivaricata]|nr:hypothetical protein BGZ54_008956 [Gamsiella multidivaricata]